MIRLGKMSDLDQILNLVEEAKELMKEHDNKAINFVIFL
jgi:hypothetical protein